MEPVFTGSWQCGQPATANDISPVSPVPSSAPASPTFYTNQSKFGDELINELLYPAGNNELYTIYNGENNINSPFVTTEGEAILIASANTLDDIHRSFPSPPAPSYQPPVDRTLNVSPALSADMNDYWTEEQSMNLELFSGLVPARMSPVVTEDVKPLVSSVETPMTTENRHNNELDQLVIQASADLTAEQQSVLPEMNADMEAKFQDIWKNILDGDQLDEISNAQIIDVSELRCLSEFDGLSSHDSLMDEDEENSSISSVGSPSQGSSGDVQELIVYTSDDSQSVLENSVSLDANMVFTLSQPSSVSGSGSDLDDDTQIMVIDNLIQGDLQSASVLAGLSQTSGRYGATSTTRSSKSNTGSRVNVVLPTYLKPERRGRKPSSANVEKSWVNLTDKVQRKKEQNKTAATRYRQKKKMEAMVTFQQEQQLQEEHEKLRKANQEISMELSLIKKLLREVMDKPKKVSIARR